eukprot:14300807-Ditylum_brightwellii.AAC.2
MDNMKANIADILSLLQDSNLHNNNNSCNRGGRGNWGGCSNSRYQARQRTNTVLKVYYCSAHGVTGGEHHTSKNCKDRNTGHKENATALNHMGGSTQCLK